MKIEKRKDLTNLYKLFYQVTLVIATAEFRYFIVFKPCLLFEAPFKNEKRKM